MSVGVGGVDPDCKYLLVYHVEDSHKGEENNNSQKLQDAALS